MVGDRSNHQQFEGNYSRADTIAIRLKDRKDVSVWSASAQFQILRTATRMTQ